MKKFHNIKKHQIFHCEAIYFLWSLSPWLLKTALRCYLLRNEINISQRLSVVVFSTPQNATMATLFALCGRVDFCSLAAPSFNLRVAEPQWQQTKTFASERTAERNLSPGTSEAIFLQFAAEKKLPIPGISTPVGKINAKSFLHRRVKKRRSKGKH